MVNELLGDLDLRVADKLVAAGYGFLAGVGKSRRALDGGEQGVAVERWIGAKIVVCGGVEQAQCGLLLAGPGKHGGAEIPCVGVRNGKETGFGTTCGFGTVGGPGVR